MSAYYNPAHRQNFAERYIPVKATCTYKQLHEIAVTCFTEYIIISIYSKSFLQSKKYIFKEKNNNKSPVILLRIPIDLKVQ